MSLIIMATYDTEENGRSKYTKETFMSLRDTVDWKKHRLVVSDNGSGEETKEFLRSHAHLCNAHIIYNGENLGTAKAINKGLKLRKPEEHCVKCDNDVVIHHNNWADEMEEALNRQPEIGILGLKRKDVEWDGQYHALPHKTGQIWITVEKGPHIMGTCTMFNWRLIDKVGGMIQAGIYGNDDSLYSLRSVLSGFWNCYLPHINIDHIDDGQNPYTQEKHRQASEKWGEYTQMHHEYINGTRPLWEDFE